MHVTLYDKMERVRLILVGVTVSHSPLRVRDMHTTKLQRMTYLY